MRSVTRKLALTSAAAVASLAAVAASVGPASADPPAGTTPAASDIVAVGSDTIQALDNGVSTAYNATAPASKFYSWDATGSNPITPKTGCDAAANPSAVPPTAAGQIDRPNGSGSGITALNANDKTCVDIARSSRGPNTGSTDWFLPFATDAVGWATYNGTGAHAPANLTFAQLQGIYNCTYTDWGQVGGTAGNTIKVYVPQAGSGTRSFFLTALGVTGSPSCWQSYTPEENEGTDSVFTGNADAIFPYSLSHYVGQVYGGKGGGNDLPGSLTAQVKLDGVNQIDTTNKVWTSTLNTKLIRSVYHVVRQADWADATEGAHLKALLSRYNSTTGTGGWLCSPAGQTLVNSYGFHALVSGSCGTPQAGV